MAPRNDKPASQADLAAAKTELKTDITRVDMKIDEVAMALVKTQADVREIKHAIQTRVATKDDISRIMNAIDGFAGKLETYTRESVTLPNVMDEHGKTLKKHENTLGEHDRRLKAVESSR